MKRIAFTALALLLIAVCVLSYAIRIPSSVDTDHDCIGEGCVLCIFSAASCRTLDRLVSTPLASALPILLLLSISLTAHTGDDTARDRTPVHLKVKLLN